MMARKMAFAARLTDRFRKFPPGEQNSGISAAETRCNSTLGSGRIARSSGFYHLVAG